MSLKGVRKGGERKPWRACLYGPPGIGKTTLGGETPKPVLVLTEDGAEGLAVDRFARAATWADVLGNVESVAGGGHDYETLVLDTVNGAVELAAADVCRRLFGGDWGRNGYQAYGAGSAATAEEVRKLLVLLDRCRDRGVHVLLLAHAGTQSILDPVRGEFSRWAPALDRRCWAVVSAWLDVIGRADFDFAVTRAGGRGKPTPTTTRVVRFHGSAAEDCKCRAGFELPAQLPLSWQAIAEALGHDTDTLPEVQRLLASGLFTPDEQAKALAWLGVARVEDAAPAKLRQLLNRLRVRATERQESPAPAMEK